jgi:hypothetical protein
VQTKASSPITLKSDGQLGSSITELAPDRSHVRQSLVDPEFIKEKILK